MTRPSVIAKAALEGDLEALQRVMHSEIPYGMTMREAWRRVLSEVAVSLEHPDPDASVEAIMDKWGRTVVSADSLRQIVQEMKEMT
jgi:hypothetical protein